MTNPIKPFRWQISDREISDLRTRLDLTRWPDQVNDADWSWGTDLETLRELAAYWRNSFDFQAAAARLNRHDQFVLPLDGLDLHFIHQRSPHPQARPLVLTHGWPGSVVEFLDVIPRLTEPERFGGRVEDAFHVVCPSIAGFAWSQSGTVPGMGPVQVARRHAALMAALGYDRYLAHGGDFGSPITQLLSSLDADHCDALHVTVLTPTPPRDVADPMALLAPHEHAWLADAERHQREGNGYFHLQTTRPQTLAYALIDSPVGLCAWITEKFHAWADIERDGVRDLRNAVSWDTLLTNVSLYWFSGCIASSMRLYKEMMRAFATGEMALPLPISRPLGVSVYPREIYKAPQEWVRRQYPLVHWHEAGQGGHFAATEQPEAFARDLWRFGQAVRERGDR